MAGKSQKQFTKDSKSRIELLREKFPYLNLNQVRRAKLPFHEALLAELNEANFHSSFELFNSLINIDIQGRKEIVKDKKLLEIIFNTLMETEKSASQKPQLLLKLSNCLAHTEQCPSWVVDEIYKQTLKAMSTMKSPLELEHTSLRISILFSYGKWLSVDKGRLDEATCHLKSALKLSKEVCGENDLQNSIREALCDTLRIHSMEISGNSPLQALKLAQKALNCAMENSNAIPVKLQVQIKIQISQCLILFKDFKNAQIVLEQTFDVTENAQLFDLGFEVLKLLIEFCCETGGNEYESKLLEQAEKHAMEKCSEKSIAEAEMLIFQGRFYTRKQIYSEALESFGKALKIYERENETRKIWEVSFMMALPKGLCCVFFSTKVEYFFLLIFSC